MPAPRNTLCSLSLFDVQFPPGGIDAFLDAGDTLWSAIDRCAAERGMEAVQVFTVGYGLATSTATASRSNTRFVFLQKKFRPPLYALLREVRKADIVIFNNESWTDILLLFVAKAGGRRAVMFYHNDVDLQKSKIPGPLMRWIRAHLLDSGMTNSVTLKKKLKQHLDVPVFIFRFGVAPHLLKPVVRRPAPDQLRLLTLGRISREKRIEDVVEGVGRAVCRDLLHLTIVGPVNERDPGYKVELDRLAADRGVTCTFRSFVPPALLPEVFAGADLLINMRPDEGFGKVFIEAMATGLPPVGRRRSPGPESLIRHDETGFLVNDSAELAALLDRMAGSPQILASVGSNAARFVAAEYTEETSHRSFRSALDAHIAGKTAEDLFYSGKSFPALRRIKRLLLNQRVDFCNHAMLEGKLVHAEAAVLQPYCIGRGIDVGCGSNKTHPDAIGVDLTPGGASGRHGNQRGQVSQADVVASGDALTMFADGELDYVIARHNLEHYQDPVRTLQEWKRVTRSGGIIGIVIPDDTYRNTIVLDPTHYHVFTPESFRRIVDLVGGLSIERLDIVVEDWSFVCIMRRNG